MAVSAFRSSSRRSNPTTTSSSSSSSSTSTSSAIGHVSPPIRRSRSVSAFSRTTTTNPDSENFSNKRDNPLFWSTDSSAAVDPKVKPAADKPTDTIRRGRSVSRNADVSVSSVRSLSRVHTAPRNRSVSRPPEPRGHSVISKSEDEQECTSSLSKKGLRTWSSQHLPSQPNVVKSSVQSSNGEDGVSTASLVSGTEEKIIKDACDNLLLDQAFHVEDVTTGSNLYEAVRSEVRRAISEIQTDLETAMQRSNTPALATTDISDIPPDLVNPSAVELILDIRREYAKKFEQSKERTKKLQSDLAVEEHRGKELSRILKEVLPDPNISNAPKSRPGRKASIERRKMSKRLTEEALAYFDECVSLSTFDSSDFSSPEDPPLNLVGITTPVDKGLSSASATNSTNLRHHEKQASSIRSQLTLGVHNHSGLMGINADREPALNKFSSNGANRAQDWKFSFAHKPTETYKELQLDIKKYVRCFEKDDMELQSVRPNTCDLGEYNLQATAQSYMLDRVLFGNRIESRGILLCAGGSLSPFASFL